MPDMPPSFDLAGHHIAVTGGGRGLGRAIALAISAAGAHVTVIARTTDQLESTAEAIKSAGHSCAVTAADLTRLDRVEGIVDDLWESGPISGIVHAAGVQLRKKAVDVTPEDWRFVQSLNVDAPYFLSTSIARRQIQAELPGSHVFIGSLNSSIGLANISPYVASKTALVGVARALSTEWAAHGLRANVIGPGYFHTEMTQGLLADPAQEQRILGRIPAGHLGDPADIGATAVFLLADASRYLTGQLINVDGGWLAS